MKIAWRQYLRNNTHSGGPSTRQIILENRRVTVRQSENNQVIPQSLLLQGFCVQLQKFVTTVDVIILQLLRTCFSVSYGFSVI